jgi:hypothetical protein
LKRKKQVYEDYTKKEDSRVEKSRSLSGCV